MRSPFAAEACINLCFHGIGQLAPDRDEDEQWYAITEDFFLAVLDLVVSRDDVALSFDDGFETDATVALPALRERGLKASFFPVAGRIGEPGFLAEEHLRELNTAGMSIGVHGYDHRVWAKRSPKLLAEELERCRECLYDVVGQPIITAACPLGEYDGSALRVLRRQGFTRVYTSDRARAVPGRWLQPRWSMNSTDTIADVQRILDNGGRSDRFGLVDRARVWAKQRR